MCGYRWLRILLVFSIASFLPACGSAGGGKVKVAFVSNNSAEFWNIAEAGCKKAEAEFGVQCVFKQPAVGNAAQQKEIIDTLLLQGIKAIAISVNDPDNQKDYLDKIAGQTILLTVDNDAPTSKRLCYFGTDNYEAGKAAGRLVKEAMPDGGTVAIFVGRMEALNARQRRQGVLDELAGSKDATGPQLGKYKLFGGGPNKTDAYTDDTDARKAKDNAVDVLTQLQQEPLVCLVGLWAYNPPAMLSAYKDSKDPEKAKRIKLVGFDEDAATLQGVEDGLIYGSVVQDPFGFGYESVKLMKHLVDGDKSGLPANGIRYFPHRIVKREAGEGVLSAAEYRKFLEPLRKGK